MYKTLLVLALFFASTAHAQSVFFPSESGTGPQYVIDISDGCAQWASNILTTTGSECGSALGSFSTTSATYFVHSSTTIPKTYTANTFTLHNIFSSLFATIASTTHATTTSFSITGLSSELLKVDASGNVVEAVAGTDYDVGLTAGDGLTRTANDFDCDTATAAALGCLTAANWSLFNDKVSSTSIDTVGEIQTLVGGQNILLETEIDGCSELLALLDDETGTCGGAVFSVGPTLTGVATLANSSTSVASFGYASSTLYFGAGLADCNTGNMLTWTSGRFGCEADDAEAGDGAFPFTPTTHFGTTTNATGTPLFMRGYPLSFFASSTAVLTNATSTQFTNTGATWLSSLTSALIVTDAAGLLAEFGGSTCTDQVATAISALGVLTCADIASSMFADADWGEITIASGVATIDDNIIESEHFGDDDWGDITISSNVAAVEDDSHAHTSGSISGLDVSADTNLAVTYPIVLTDDTVSIAFGTTTANTWSAHNIFSSAFFTSASTTNATTTGTTYLTSLTSALVSAGADGLLGEFAGSTCTNQAATAISALGALTCTTLTPAYLDMTTTWDFGGATALEIPNGTGPTLDAIGEIALDTTQNEILVATSTSGTDPIVIKPYEWKGFAFGTSTQGSGTTTKSWFIAPPSSAGYMDLMICHATSTTAAKAFMNVVIRDETDNQMNYAIASSTEGTVKLTTNNAFTGSEVFYANIGTTTNIAAPLSGSCWVKIVYTRN